MGDSCWVHTIITQVDILDIDGCSTISPEACDVDMGGIDVVVELCAGIIFIGFQVMQVQDNLCLTAETGSGRTRPIVVGIKKSEGRTCALGLAELYHQIFVGRKVNTIGILPSAKAILTRYQFSRCLVKRSIFQMLGLNH